MYCGTAERHRLTWVYLQQQTDLFNGGPKSVLHVAPEPFFEDRLRSVLGRDYLTADLLNPRAMVKMDITDIQYPDDTFDVVYCSHVLEHVPDDRKAMRELRRVMKPDGWAILLVPITADATFEDPSITDPQERLRAFGQEDHVRRYGPDYLDRLREAGFDVRVSKVHDFLATDDINKMGIDTGEEIFFCTK
jgi:SAM-dependent methyltransferase